MATITLTGGYFGTDASIVVGEEAFYLPDPLRSGLTERLPFAGVDSIEALSDDRGGQVKQAAKLAARGFAGLGPLGLAAGMLAVRKVKDVNFTVRLKDGRSFTATADAITFANLRAATLKGDAPDPDAEAASARADAVIARYLDGHAPAGAEDREVQPLAESPVADTAVAAAVPEEPPMRPVFGRRGR